MLGFRDGYISPERLGHLGERRPEIGNPSIGIQG